MLNQLSITCAKCLNGASILIFQHKRNKHMKALVAINVVTKFDALFLSTYLDHHRPTSLAQLKLEHESLSGTFINLINALF